MPIVNVNGYATLTEAKDWCKTQTAEHDIKLENVITSVSRWIEQHCQRQFWATAAGVARVFDTCDCYVLDLGPFNDAVAVTGVATDEDDDGTYETVWAGSDFQPTPVNTNGPETLPYRKIRAVGGRLFPRRWTPNSREGLIQVTGTWGWPAVPADVNQACLIQTSRIFRRKDAPEGTVGFAEFGVVRMQGRLDADVQAMLAAYRRTAVLVA